MKINYFFLILLFISSLVYSQTEKGKYIIGGNTNFSAVSSKQKIKSDFSTEDGSDFFSISVAPIFGYFVIDDLAIGISLPFTYSRFNQDNFIFPGSIVKTESTRFAVTPFLRYYLGKNNIKPFIQVSSGLGRLNYKETYKTSPEDDFEFKFNLFEYGISGGISIFVNSNVSIDLGVGYQSDKRKDREDNIGENKRNITNAFHFNAGFSVFL